MMLTAGMEAAEGKSQCSPGFTGGGAVWPETTLTSGAGGGGSADTAGAFSGGISGAVPARDIARDVLVVDLAPSDWP